ncbi:MAG: hypothetical protein ACI8ZM_004918 [Crocinitomix sp.]|jgi:hypothetical protein
MKKLTHSKIFLFCSLIFLSTFVFGQIEVNESYRYNFIEKIGNSNALAYTIHQESPKVLSKTLTTFDITGKQLSKIEIPFKQFPELEDCISVGENTVFYFSFSYSKDILLLVVDNKGQEVSRKTIEYLKVFGTDLKSAGTDKFYLVAGVKNKKQGVSVECFNLSLESQWNYSKIPEKSKYFYTNSAVNSNGDVAIIYSIKSVDDHILFIDANGNETGDQQLNKDEVKHYAPYKMHFKSADELLVFADYGTYNEAPFMTTPIGLNIKHFNKSAEEISNQNLEFDAVREQWGNRAIGGELVAEPTPSLRVVDIQTINGRSTLIAESYYLTERSETVKASSPQAQPTTVVTKILTMLDLYLLDMDNLAENMERIWKPARAISVKGIKYYDATDFCNLIEKKNMFGYQGITEDQLLIRGFSQNHEYFNTIPFDVNWENVSTRTYFGRPINDVFNSRGSVQSFARKSGIGPIPGMGLSGFIQSNDHLVLYRFHSPTANLQFTVIK